MMDKENYIRNRVGDENPFRVPEGYFEDFASQVMAKLPERTPVAIPTARVYRLRLRTWLCTAACVCVGMFGAVMYFARVSGADANKPEADVASSAVYSAYDTYDEAVVDYMMIDNADIYAYLTDSSAE